MGWGKRLIFSGKHYSTVVSQKIINDRTFETDSFTNITPKMISYLNRNIFNQKEHPICLLKERIVQFFYDRFKNPRGNPVFSVYDNLDPIVTTEQNFDSLLISKDHPSRAQTDTYYINKEWLLRTHMTSHQAELLKMGLNNFLMVGEVYRRDTIDQTHHPVFHQLDGVRLFTPEELFIREDDGSLKLQVKEEKPSDRTKEKQEMYTLAATQMVEKDLKRSLQELSKELFGGDVKYKWVEAYFPFTHPSWELEVLVEGKWIELLGCGVMEHEILKRCGCGDRIGWAFGLGLDRLAMVSYSIPDIRIFWSTDPGFLIQFQGKTPRDKVTFKPFSQFPSCAFDVSFWVGEKFEPNDFYDMARRHWGDIIEQISPVDVYKCKKTGRESRCYRVVYRSMEKTFTKEELNVIHKKLEEKLVEEFKVVIR